MSDIKIDKNSSGNTIVFDTPVFVSSSCSIAGKHEGEGPLSRHFDIVLSDAKWDEDTWEKTESILTLRME